MSAGNCERMRFTSRTTSSYFFVGIGVPVELDPDHADAVERLALHVLDVVELVDRVLDRVDDEPLDVRPGPRPG